MRDTIISIPYDNGWSVKKDIDPLAVGALFSSIVLAYGIFWLGKRLNVRQHEKDILVEDLRIILDSMSEIGECYSRAASSPIVQDQYDLIVAKFSRASMKLTAFEFTISECSQKLKRVSMSELKQTFLHYKKLVTGGRFNIGIQLTPKELSDERQYHRTLTLLFRRAIIDVNRGQVRHLSRKSK